MEITYPTDLIASIKDKHLLLDTNVFRDATTQPTLFNNFFNELKRNGVTLVTSDFVKYELLKGSANESKYNEKLAFINHVIDAVIPTTPQLFVNAYELIKGYQIDGAGISLTDLLLGALLKLHKQHIFLLSRDTSAFILRLYNLTAIVNCPLQKGIFTYGVYEYQ